MPTFDLMLNSSFFKIFGNPAGCWLSFLVDVEDERGTFRVSEEERVMLLSAAPISDEAEEEEDMAHSVNILLICHSFMKDYYGKVHLFF